MTSDTPWLVSTVPVTLFQIWPGWLVTPSCSVLGSGIHYVMISGFVNGAKGRKMLPAYLVKSSVDNINLVQVCKFLPRFAVHTYHRYHQVLFVMCNVKKQALFTAKVLMASAKGIQIVDSDYILLLGIIHRFWY